MAKAKITRIKANDKTEVVKPTEKKVVEKDKKPVKDKKKTFILFRPFCALGRYIRDSWREIRQVRWPNRKATWKMVFAVLIYTALFVTILVLLDLLFQFIFNTILK